MALYDLSAAPPCNAATKAHPAEAPEGMRACQDYGRALAQMLG